MNSNGNIQVRLGDVLWVKFTGQDHVQHGMRPAVVIQNNKGNHYSNTIQVFSMTSKYTKASLPTHVVIPAGVGGLPKHSVVQCEAARTIDKTQIVGYIGHLPRKYMKKITVASIISMPLLQYLTMDQVEDIYFKVAAIS